MLRRVEIVATVVAIALASPARAERVVAMVPLSTLDAEDTSSSTRKLTGQIEVAITALPGNKVVTAAQVAAAIRRAKKPHLGSCEGEAACLAELGKLVGAQVVIAGQVGGLGESKVVYLGATDVATGKELRSTTLAVGAKADPNASMGAVVRLLDPGRYRGTVRLSIDAAGATVFVNGSRVRPSARGELALPVGTQALRVTHPQYRDFVRFVDVAFGRTTEIAVGMTQYPIVHRDVQGNPINSDRIHYIDPPVWRRWYVVGPAAVGLVVVTAIVVGTLAKDIPSAECREVGGNPC